MGSPRRRIKRLQQEFDRVRELHDRGGLIGIEEALGDPPESYIIRYDCKGIERVSGGQPYYRQHHLVKLELTGRYPIEEPLMHFITPVYHPNVSARNGLICIGKWYPAKTLDQLVLMIGDMIQYKNYGSNDPFNGEAAVWAAENNHLFPVDTRNLLTPGSTSVRQSRADAIDDINIVIL